MVIVDRDMPDMDGLALCRTIRSESFDRGRSSRQSEIRVKHIRQYAATLRAPLHKPR